MEGARVVFLTTLFLAATMVDFVKSTSATAPAFLWSPQNHGLSHVDNKETVDYRVLSPKDLVNSVLFEGGWSNFMCAPEKLRQNMDVALVYVGKKLQSSDISKSVHMDPTLMDLLKTSFTTSNISMSFPYVDVSDEKNTLENSLISTFVESCGNELGIDDIAYMESCSIDGKNLQRLQGPKELEDFVVTKMENGVSGKTSLIVYCDDGSYQSEGKTLSTLVEFLKKYSATYSVLYASDPYMFNHYHSHLAMRSLAEHNTSVNSTLCDGVCQLKSSLLEGLFVAIVLLIILISGLCCMMGIDTPTRFEAPQES